MSRHDFYAGKVFSEKGFYIGDICYALKDEIYDDVWGKIHEYEDGCYPVGENGSAFAVGSTAYGDGCYVGSDGFSYGVDAGVIGIISLELVDHNDGGKIYEGAGWAKYEFSEGHFKFTLPDGKVVEIETGYEEDEEEDYWWESDEETGYEEDEELLEEDI